MRAHVADQIRVSWESSTAYLARASCFDLVDASMRPKVCLHGERLGTHVALKRCFTGMSPQVGAICATLSEAHP